MIVDIQLSKQDIPKFMQDQYYVGTGRPILGSGIDLSEGVASMAEQARNGILDTLHAALEREPRINLHRSQINSSLRQNALVLEGTLDNIAEKKIAFAIARHVACNLPVLDRLRVKAGEVIEDGALRDKVLNALLHEPVFARYGIQVARNGTPDVVRETLNEDGWAICIAARSGVVQLSGKVDSLSHRRLAEVRAWWTGGCELVENMLKVSPPERETDDELTDAVRLVLEMDPLVHADQIYARARDGVVTLEGYVTSKEEKKLAIMDTWYIPGVHEVADRLAARS